MSKDLEQQPKTEMDPLLNNNNNTTSNSNNTAGGSITAAAAADNKNPTSKTKNDKKLPPLPIHRRIRSMFTHENENDNQDPRSQFRQHHRRLTSVSELLQLTGGSIRNGLGSIAEDVHVTSQEVQTAFQDDMQKSKRGQRYFLDMSMTRSLSVLPSDLSELWEEVEDFKRTESSLSDTDDDTSSQQHHPLLAPIDTTTTTQQQQAKEDKSSSSSIFPYLSLLTAVLAVSSNGTALSMLHGVNPCLKLYWRMTATACVLSFFAIRTMIREYRSNGNQAFSKLSVSTCIEFACAVVCFAAHTLLFFNAFEHTTIGNAVIFANSQALLLIIGKACVGERILWVEGIGVVVAFSGAILCSADSEGGDSDGDGKNDFFENLLGDGLALGAAATGVMYLTFAKAVRSHISVTVFMFLVMVIGSWLVVLFMTVSGVPFEFNRNPKHGLFGWLTMGDDENGDGGYSYNLLILIYIAIICNVCGTMGFVRAMQFFDNLIITVATLLEPMIASFIAYAFGVGPMPGVLGWIGNVLVACGTLGVVYPTINQPGGGGGH